MVKLVNPNGEQTTWAYQANDWLTAQTTNAASSTPVETTYSYYARGWMKELKTTQGLQGQGLTPTLIADFAGSGGSTPSMTYDALGNRTSLTASGFPTGTGTFNGLTSFVYNARDELTGETSARAGSYSAPFVYDGVTTNTTTGPGDATSERSVAFTFDPHGDNQIATDGGHYSWTYDGDGNPVTYLSKTNAFDPENRMTAYAIPTGGGHAALTMGYDDDGMRAWKENSSATRTYFIYDGSDLLAELTSAGALSNYQTVGADGLVSRRAGITTTYFAFDPEGSVSAVLNYTGTVRGDEMFEANGRRDGSYSSRPVDFGGQWGYYGDNETGLTLLGHRYYDSYAGRFLTRDPIGYDGGVNLYSYTANNYENESDASGFLPLTVDQRTQTEDAINLLQQSGFTNEANSLTQKLNNGHLQLTGSEDDEDDMYGFTYIYPWTTEKAATIYISPKTFNPDYAHAKPGNKYSTTVFLAATLYHEYLHTDCQGSTWQTINPNTKEDWARAQEILFLKVLRVGAHTGKEEGTIDGWINFWYHH